MQGLLDRVRSGAILVGERTGKYDARAAEIAALQEAVAHAHSTQNVDRLGGEGWFMLYGLACYDRWIRDFAGDPPRLPTMGDRYCFGVNRSTHRAAAGFLRELAAKYPEGKEPLERAAMHLSAEADALNEVIDRTIAEGQLTNPDIQCVGLCINTQKLSEEDAKVYMETMSHEHGLPCVDPIRTGMGPIVDEIQKRYPS